MKFILLLILNVLVISVGFHAQSTLDGLIAVKDSLKGRQRVLLFKQIGDSLFDRGDFKEASSYYENSAFTELALKKPELKYVCQGLTEAGFCFETINQYQTAIAYYEKSLVYAKQAADKEEEANIYNNMGTSYFHIGNYVASVKYFELALKIDKSLSNEEMLSIDYNNLGKVYESWKKFTEALSYYKLSLDITIKENNLARKAIRMSSIGMVFKHLNQLDSAAWYVNEALKIDTQLGNREKIAIRLSNLATVYTLMNKFNEAEQNLKKAITIFEELGINYSQAISLNDLGDCYMQQNRFSEAKNYYFKSLNKSIKANVRLTTLNNYEDLSSLFEKIQDYRQSLLFFKKYSDLKDSIFTEKNLHSLNELQVKFETEKKENEIIRLEQKEEISQLKLKKSKNRVYFLIGFIFLSIILLITLYNRFLLKKRNNIKLDEKNQELNRLNATKDKFFTIIAHDLKNPLSAFRNISKGLKENIAEMDLNEQKYFLESLNQSADNLNSLLGNLLHWAKSQTASIKYNPSVFNVYKLVDGIIKIEQHKSPERKIIIENKITDDMELENDENIFSTIIRNLIANAIKFSEGEGKISISSYASDHKIVFSVEDNGIGICTEDLDKLFRPEIDQKLIGNSSQKGTGLGLILCKELVTIIGGNIWAESELTKGSKFSFSIPQ